MTFWGWGELDYIHNNKLWCPSHQINRVQDWKASRMQLPGHLFGPQQQLSFKIHSESLVSKQKQIKFPFVLWKTDHWGCLFVSSGLWWCYLQSCLCLSASTVTTLLSLSLCIHYSCQLFHSSLHLVWKGRKGSFISWMRQALIPFHLQSP